MKKIIIACLMCLLIMTSCASKKNSDGIVMGKNGVPMPDWYTVLPHTEEIHYAVGEFGFGHEVGAKGISAKSAIRDSAILAARTELARWVNTTISAAQDSYSKVAGSNTTSEFLIANRNFAQAVVDQMDLAHTTVYEEWITPEGNVAVLVGLEIEEVVEVIEETTEDLVEEYKENPTAATAINEMAAMQKEYFGSPELSGNL